MPDFSYQTDVAPYASNLFRRIESSPFLSSARSTELSTRLLDTVDAARKRSVDTEKDSLAIELSRTRLANDRLALEDARDELRLKREAIAKAPEVDAAFEAILNDPSLDSKQKKAEVNRFAMRNADAITRSPMLAAKYRFAASAAEPDEKEPFTPYQMYQIGRTQLTDQEKAAKEQKEAVEKAAKEQKESVTEKAKSLESVINSATLEPEDTLTDPNKPRGFRDPLDKIRIVGALKRSGLDEKALENLSAVELVQTAVNRKNELSSAVEPKTDAENPLLNFIFSSLSKKK